MEEVDQRATNHLLLIHEYSSMFTLLKKKKMSRNKINSFSVYVCVLCHCEPMDCI